MLSALTIGVFGVLYRLRGGWFADLTGIESTQLMRAIWAVPAGMLIYFYAVSSAWWLVPALIVSVFLSLALWGHGAHMIFDTQEFVEKSKNKTEFLTDWLPSVFGGVPDASWSSTTLYNLIGMSTIGVARHATMILPLWFVESAGPLVLFTAAGVVHGPLYWVAWRLGGRSQLGEVFVGGAMAATVIGVL